MIVGQGPMDPMEGLMLVERTEDAEFEEVGTSIWSGRLCTLITRLSKQNVPYPLPPYPSPSPFECVKSIHNREHEQRHDQQYNVHIREQRQNVYSVNLPHVF